MNKFTVNIDGIYLGVIRTVDIDAETWFVASDVTTVLGFDPSSETINKNVDYRDIELFNANVENRIDKMIFINESGFYSLLLNSELQLAKSFRHWVTNKVLQQLIKQGTVDNDILDCKQVRIWKTFVTAKQNI